MARMHTWWARKAKTQFASRCKAGDGDEPYRRGDFLNDYEGIRGHEHYRDELGLMYFPTLHPQTGRLPRLQMTPTRIRRFQACRATPGEAAWLADVRKREGRVFGTHVSMDGHDRLTLHGGES